jgi:hypothetical protein
MTSPPLLATLVAGLALATASSLARADAALTLGTSAERFTVNGEPRFLALVSYFDALDAAALDDDLALIAKSADGVRIFANWWDAGVGECPNAFSDTTLMARSADGTLGLRQGRIEGLKHVLGRARAHGLVVDLTFAADPVKGASKLSAGDDGRVCPPAGFENVIDWASVAAAIGEVAAALTADEYDHVFFDLQNEAGHPYNRATDADLARLVAAVRARDTRRLLSISSFDPDGDRQAAQVQSLRLSMLNFHDVPRGEGWGERTAGHVERFRAALKRAGVSVPIYAGEPDPDAHGRGVAEYRAAVTGARDAGAGAWTFHHRDAYQLGQSRLEARLDPVTREVLDALPGWLNRTVVD